MNHTTAIDEDRHHPAGIEPHEFEMLDDDPPHLRSQDDSDVLRHTGELARGFSEEIRDLTAAQLHRLVDLLHLPRADARLAHELIHEQAVRPVGRNAAGGGVRLRQQAAFLEVGHDVPDRRGRQVQPAAAREHARAHGLSVMTCAWITDFKISSSRSSSLPKSGRWIGSFIMLGLFPWRATPRVRSSGKRE
jgi:hypothetical protein